MVLTIVTGASKSTSSLPLPTPTDVTDLDETNDEGSRVHHDISASGTSNLRSGDLRRTSQQVLGTPLVAVGTDSSSTFVAELTISYVDIVFVDGGHDQEDVGDDDYQEYDEDGSDDRKDSISRNEEDTGLIADLRISISPVSSPLSRKTRETTCRLRLPTSLARIKRQDMQYYLTDVCPTVIFSDDGRYLSCLVPCPTAASDMAEHHPSALPSLSSLVIFTLKHLESTDAVVSGKVRSDEDQSTNGELAVPVAVNPRSVAAHPISNTGGGNSSNSWTPRVDRITSICSAAYLDTSVLLAGTADGAILAVGYRRARIAGVLYRPPREGTGSFEDSVSPSSIFGLEAIVCMDHMTPLACEAKSSADDSRSSRGRLATVQADGSVAVYKTIFLPASVRRDGSASPLQKPIQNGPLRHRAESNGSISVGHICDRSTDSSPNQLLTPSALSNCSSEEGLDAVKKTISFSTSKSFEAAGLEKPVPSAPSGIESGGGAVKALSKTEGSSGSGLMMKIEHMFAIQPSDSVPMIARASWFDFNHIALVARPYQPGKVDLIPTRFSAKRRSGGSQIYDCKETVAQVWRVSDELSLMAKLQLTPDGLMEASHGTFRYRCPSERIFRADTFTKNQTESASTIPIAAYGSCLGASRHRSSHCLALSSVLLVLSQAPEEVTTRVGSRFAQQISAEDDFAGAITPSSNELNIPREILLRPFVCVWDWRNGVRGMTMRSAFDHAISNELATRDSSNSVASMYCSRYLFDGQRPYVAHLYAGPIMSQKAVYEIGFLSPSSVDEGGECSVHEPAALLLFQNRVAFPVLRHPAANQDSTIFWKESLIPAQYYHANGNTRLAAVGRRLGRSIAIASSRGLCVLDLSLMIANSEAKSEETNPIENSPCVIGRACSQSLRNESLGMKITYPKWRLFRNEEQEQSFRVVAMVWWERSSEGSTSDDILIAAIEYSSDLAQRDLDTSQYYLVCWSRRRLSMGQNQLLADAGADCVDYDNGKGISLPKGMKPDSLSILAEPEKSESTKDHNHNHIHKSSTRAVILVSHHQSMTYMAYQLQAIDSSPASVVDEPQNQCRVLTRLCSTGVLQPSYHSEVGSSVFLAGASFQFDLSESLGGFNTHAYVGTIGIIQSDGCLSAVCITPTGPNFGGVVIPASSEDGSYRSQIASFWLSDDMEEIQMSNSKSIERDSSSSFYWTVTRNDGRTYCWRVPLFSLGQTRATTNVRVQVESTTTKPHLNENISPPFCVSASHFFIPRDKDSRPKDSQVDHDFLGRVCYIGDSSFITGHATNDDEIVIGPLPASCSSSIMYMGQTSRQFNSQMPGMHGANLNYHSLSTVSAPRQLQVYGAGDLIIGPAATAPCLFFSFVDLTDSLDSQRSETLRKNIENKLLKRQSKDSILSALRMIILTIVSDLARTSKRVGHRDSSQFLFARKLLSEVVSTMRAVFSELQFCSFFLSLGRQIEPHDFGALFPLPITSGGEGGVGKSARVRSCRRASATSARTIEDLFLASMVRGSVAVTSASLPLLPSKAHSLNWCKEIFRHCLKSVRESIALYRPFELDEAIEEKEFIRQLFNFGLKLEEVIGVPDDSNFDFVSSRSDLSSPDDPLRHSESKLISTSTRLNGSGSDDVPGTEQARSRMSRLLSMIKPALWDGAPRRDDLEEKAISEAASVFIQSVFHEDGEGGFEFDPVSGNIDTSKGEFVKTTQGAEESFSTDESSTSGHLSAHLSTASLLDKTMVDIVCEQIVGDFVRTYDTPGIDCGWKGIAIIARLLVHEPPSSTTANTSMLDFFGSISEADLASSLIAAKSQSAPSSPTRSLIDNIQIVSSTISDGDAGRIFYLMLSLLSRCNVDRFDSQSMRLPLALVTIIVGHVSGKMDGKLFGKQEDESAVGIWYRSVVRGGLSLEV